MNKKQNLLMVGLLLINLIVQPIVSIQNVFAEEENSTIDSQTESFEQVENLEVSSEIMDQPISSEEEIPSSDSNEEIPDSNESDLSNDELLEETDSAEIISEETEEVSANTTISFLNKGSESEEAGSASTFEFNVSNTGNVAENIVIRVQLPSTYISEFTSLEEYFSNQGLNPLTTSYEGNNLSLITI